jgi:hypothetical protein
MTALSGAKRVYDIADRDGCDLTEATRRARFESPSGEGDECGVMGISACGQQSRGGGRGNQCAQYSRARHAPMGRSTSDTVGHVMEPGVKRHDHSHS